MTAKHNVELEVSNVSNNDAARSFIDELAHQYADLEVSDVNVSSSKISFKVGSPGMDDLTSADIKFRIEEFTSMNIAPFTIKGLKVD